jgi:gamma-glutamylcyclotransferase (GGCT)/AIG2-like uncharacterized protein YtfP
MEYMQEIMQLSDAVSKINDSNIQYNSVEKCEKLLNALNITYNAYYKYRKISNMLSRREIENEQSRKRPSENESLIQLILQGMNRSSHFSIINSKEFKMFMNLKPPIMDDGTLEELKYDPSNILPETKAKAQAGHRKLIDSHLNFKAKPSDSNLKEVLSNMSRLIYTVRNNMKHCGKTPQGPDLKKVDRDEKVCAVTVPLINLIFEILYNFPSTRLAAYGTLKPGEINNSILDKYQGKWYPGSVNGYIEYLDGLPYFKWNLAASAIEVMVFESKKNFMAEIDRFEGNNYKRILIPIKVGDKLIVGNIYEMA